MCSSAEEFRRPEGKISKMPVHMLILLAMIDAGLVKDSQLDEGAELEVSKLGKFKDLCDNNRIVIEEIMRMPLRDDYKMNPIRQLNAFLGKIGLRLEKGKRTRRGGAPIIRYVLDPVRWASMQKLSAKFTPQDQVIERLK